jgi:hypothetical protein
VGTRTYGCQAKFIHKLAALELDKRITAYIYGDETNTAVIYCFNEELEKAEEASTEMPSTPNFYGS